MARLLRIENCDECNYRAGYEDKCYAVWPYRELDCKVMIPDWCPLPNADAEDVDEQMIVPESQEASDG